MRDVIACPTQRLAAMAERSPDDPAIIEVRDSGTSTWTWSDLERQSGRVAALLARLGVGCGQVVAYQLANRAEFVAITLGALRCGAVCCPLMPIFRERELEDLLRRAGARVVFIAEEHRGRYPPQELACLEARLPALEAAVVVPTGHRETPLPHSARVHWSWWHRALEALPPAARPAAASAPDPKGLAQLLFTSGTSGEPKGVLHRRDALVRAVAMHIDHLKLDARDRIYVPSPLAHQTGFLYGMWLALALGVAQILQETWSAARGLEALARGGGTFVQAATPFLADLVQAVDEGAEPPESLRLFVATGAAVPRALARRATETLRSAVCGAFGTTEGCLAALGSPSDPAEKAWGTDGRALRSVRLRIRDETGRVLGPGEEGHFETHSPTMFEGYLDHPDWTAAAYTADGWYRTGDLGLIDAAGYLHVTGRVKDVINRGGEKIPVAEIEQLLHQHGAVKEIAIVAMPDPRLGERACAFVVPRAGATLDFPSMQRFLDERRVAKPYWPERLEVLESLPRTPSGKIQKFRLRERARALVSAGAE